MKRVSLLVFATLLLVSGNAFASKEDPRAGDPSPLETVPSKICDQIELLLEKNNGFYLGDKIEDYAVIRFTLNSEKEIVVLSVNTEDERLEIFVKARLNYEKVADSTLLEGQIYALPIRLRA